MGERESQDKFIRATQIVPDEDLSPETSISLFGHVLDRHCKPISNATVDVWYAGGKPAAYTFPPSKLWYRGRTNTDSNGWYHFEATYPGMYSDRPIPLIHYKVYAGGEEFTTQLYFRGDVSMRETQYPHSVQDRYLGRDV